MNVKVEVVARSCNTRLGYFEIENKKIKIPNILWYSSDRIKAPEFAEIKLGEEIKIGGSFFYPEECKFCIPPSLSYAYFLSSDFPRYLGRNDFFSFVSKNMGEKEDKIYIMANSKEAYSNPRDFVEYLTEIREKIGYKILYAPAIANPLNLAILAYCGIDLFDSVDLIFKSRKKIYFTSEGEFDLKEMNEYPCSCMDCRKGIENFEDLLFHNYEIMKNELVKVRECIKNGNLREYVESKIHFSTHLASIIRIMDIEKYTYQEKRYPINGKNIIASPYSLYRPDILRFRERICNVYRKPRSANILLLLPCSSKKPYSKSKSHKKFKEIISSFKNKNIIHEVIITSPLAIVPRELEYTYPSAHYDVSTIGYWDKEEIDIIKKCFEKFIHNNKYDVVINHLPYPISSIFELDALNTCIDHPTSPVSLKKLSDTLKICEDFEYVSKQKRDYENVLSMLYFQFLKPEKFMENCFVKGNFPRYKIYYENKQIASFVPERGLFSLTLEGGKKMGKNYWVEIEDFYPKGSIFACGILDADEKIRVGDEVIVFHEKEVRAVGVAKMNSEEMIESSNGEAIKVRHHIQP
ncbi:MAG: archaeosine synthase subunit alpha [Candidatus Thermoplasmatota archaeon]